MGRASREKRIRRELRLKGFTRMNMKEANDTCGPWRKEKAEREKCPRCEMDVFLHCELCKIQITGCLCSAVERMTDDDLKKFREEIQKRKAREAGLVLPGEVN